MPRPLALTFFVALICAFLALANYVVLNAFALVFALTLVEQLVLAVLLSVLSAGFIALTILGNWFNNWCTTVLYHVCAIWIGCMVYLFLGSVVLSLLVAFVPTLAFSAGVTLIGAATLATIYGVFHGRTLVIKRVIITLPNVPEAWRGRKVVWISDLHLGQLRRPAFARKVTQAVMELSPNIIFIGGDLYDGARAIDAQYLIEPMRQMQAPLGVLFVMGNHEEYGNREQYMQAIQALGIRVLNDELIEIDGLQIVGVDFNSASKRDHFKKLLAKLPIDKNKTTLLLKHEPQDLDVAQAADINLQISGHTHRAQQWPLGYIARMVYKGYAYGLKKFNDMEVYVSSGTGTWGPPLRVGTDCEIVVITFN